MPEDHENQIREQDDLLSEISYTSRTEQLQELVNFLVSNFKEIRPLSSEAGMKNVITSRDLKVYADWLEKTHAFLQEALNQELTLTLAAEWVLDNYYIIRQAILQIGEDLPAGYYKQLPKLAGGPLKGLPRIYAIGRTILLFQSYLLNTIDLQTILIQVQEQVPLTMGELWALPIFLRYNLIEILAHALEWIIRPQHFPELPIFNAQSVGIGNTFNENHFSTGDTSAGGVVANIILSLRTISEQSWNDFFEASSSLERTLREDPAEIYPLMDFKTRDLYRKEIESLSFVSGHEENELAHITLELARENRKEKLEPVGEISESDRRENSRTVLFSHVGEYLLGSGRKLLEQRIGYHPDTREAIKRWVMQHASASYLGSIFSLSLLILGLILLIINLRGILQSGSTLQWISTIVLLIALLIPILIISTTLVNWLITLRIKPRILPKLLFMEGIPDPFRTLVVIPALITSHREIDSLILQLEMNFLRNPERGLRFALLTDFSDADSENQPRDEELVRYAQAAIEKLNDKYGNSINGNHISQPKQTGNQVDIERSQLPVAVNGQLFYLLHRKRLWNQSEGKWIGWERKRGKLHELNRLLRGDKNTSFSTISAGTEESAGLQGIHFVITLDADTILPRGAARRLAGTLAHPLNQAKFNEATGQVLSGYTVLQPRMEIHPRSTHYSWFTRIFAGDTGLDLYTRAVSDAYQDLFGEGSYVGKGIYDVDAFERSVDQHIPENSILSHDLLEGILGRAGLVTDISMVEDYPSSYYAQVKRQQRWIRGDWQLLPWLIRPRKFQCKFSAVDRWKILDNLFRSMLDLSLLFIFFLGIVSMPEHTVLWIAIVLLSLGIPVLTSMARGAIQTLGGERFNAVLLPLKWSFVRWILAVAFLPYETYNALDAILTTLYRLFISRRNLLQWTTAAQTAHLFGLQVYRNTAWLRMIVSTLTVVISAGGILLIYSFVGISVTPELSFSIPMLLLWVFSPLIIQWIDQPITEQPKTLSQEQTVLFRQVARRSWGYFERFVGPEDHWLPPDHFQEAPVGIIAHHTSPSNIGLMLTSTLAAYDLGYLDQLGLATRLSITLDTLDRLERFRGHFFNWYDTKTLQPLKPRYISTVDSGNLAACMIVITQACYKLPHERIFRWVLWQGYLDTLSNLIEILEGMPKAELDRQVEVISQRITRMQEQISAIKTVPNQWYSVFQSTNEIFWPDLSERLIELITVGSAAFDLVAIRKLQEVAAQVDRHHQDIQRTISELVPWIKLLEHIPVIFNEPQFVEGLSALRDNLPYNPPLDQIQTYAGVGETSTTRLRNLLNENKLNPDHDSDLENNALEWLDSMDRALVLAEANAEALMNIFAQNAARAERFVMELDFKFLYHPQLRVFHNGFNLDTGQLDNNHYDLLASEARIASVIALAKGEVSQSHWLQLNRPITRVEGRYVLLSWNATMFEYLMPPLFFRSYPGTLLAESAEGSILHQIAYGKKKGIPWGISESGFFLFDANQNYQYRAFGVPGLGFKRGLGDDMVVAPYASMMAIGYNPHIVAQNLASLMEYECFGMYGLYESIDFTPDRVPVGEASAVVHEYMTHHQGMILMALANYFRKDIMVRRMHSDPRIQSVELLLQEQIPQAVPLQNPYSQDVKGLLRLASGPVEINPWSVPVQTSIPIVNLLSNGDYGVLLSNMGGGYSTWRGIDLTRWQADGVLDPWGTWIYVQEMNTTKEENEPSGKLWSAGFQPIPASVENMQVTFFAHMVVFHRTENNITSTMEITVCPDDPVEIRRLHLHSTNKQPYHLRLTSYGEVILTQQATDRRHPAFNKLFIENEFVPELNLQIFTRRPRSNEEKPVFMAHMLVVNPKAAFHDSRSVAYHEADRDRFIGRGRTLRNPAALNSKHYLTGTAGATLDPIFALGREVRLNPHESAELAYLTFAGESREAIMALAKRYSNWSLIERSYHQADLSVQAWLGKQNYDSQEFQNTLKVLSALIYPYSAARASSDTIAKNRLGQYGLWRFGISGDYPIMLVEIEDPKHIDLIREVLQVHEFLRSRNFMVDIVIINHQQIDYGAELNGMLYRLVNRLNSEQWLTKRGGIYILYADHLNPEEHTLLLAAARFIFKGSKGLLNNQIPDYMLQVAHLPELIPTRFVPDIAVLNQNDPLPTLGELQFFNGFGGFSKGGREYIIELSPDRLTPAPWVNVIGYPYFGFMVSETGSQCTWAVNSGENRLTPWSNDPVCDTTGEALYLRDEETGEVWSPTPLPAGDNQPYRVIHGAGYTIFEHHSNGLRQRLTLFASPEDPVKIIHLRVENSWNHNRRITATQYIEWVLGNTHAESLPYIISEYDAAEYCLLARNPYNAEFSERTAFLIANKPVHGLTTDRSEFLGRGRTLSSPAALHRIGLETRLTPSEDVCAVLQLHIDLLPGGIEEIYFVVGQGNSKENALELARKYHDSAYVGAALERTKVFWNHLLNTVQVHTPEPATDLILNHWMLYQSLSCRIWGRSAFYQSSGAYGFRDQLQDILALLAIDPAISRGQILNAAQFQFTEGDVLHWWHPPSGRGVRTRISDDLLWLPYVTALYVETTGDLSLLEEKISFLEAPTLSQDEIERYNAYPRTEEALTLFEHCLRAIKKGTTSGQHGLPLIGTGDWNDALNQVGKDGKGESVWLAWFLCDVLERFANVCELHGDSETAEEYRSKSKEYASIVEQTGWDGAWYRRAYYDDGSSLGSIEDSECKIDGIAQSWAVLSGAGNPERSQKAMRSVLEWLVRSDDRLSLLFTPPFDKSEHNPGYIKGYLPGIRENGGQYTHAAI
jgi:cyclic beta-1,2-glucan synthetase